ncbi:MAG: DNA mismatch repair endonuclease MutL [Chitinophagales bacterium]
MGDIIHLLPDSIANQIAAGEVIQRPASAVKELLENAVDAGATDIRLFIKDAGKTLIQVIDNGCGMSTTDARLCFERHATSKIRSADDLFHIRTKGFRGEALASIAAIAQVEMKTRQHDAELGTRIQIEGFTFKGQEQVQCPAGTNLSIKNLFYNVPARRNFLKSNTVELKHIIEEFERVALAHANIFFSMQHNGIELFHLKPANLRQRIIHLFGNNYNEKLVPVEENTSVTNIRGFIGKPDSAKKTRGEQFFFVNNRFIKSNYLHHAIMSVYADLLPENSFPLYTLFIDIDPTRIDVNVHPTKQEIKFEDERIIYTFIQAGVRHALAQYSITPTLDFEQDPTFANLPSYFRKQETEEKPAFKTIESRMNEMPETGRGEFPGKQVFEREEPEALTETDAEQKSTGAEFTHAVFQLHNRYIVTQIKSGYILVDQQAAHERILYELYLDRMQNKQHFSQQQLFPKTIELPAGDAALLQELLDDVNKLGFDIQPFGQNSFVIHGIPAEFEHMHEVEVIEHLIEQYKTTGTDLQLNKHQVIARSLARSNAVQAGQELDQASMRRLIDSLFACSTPYVSPYGTPTFITFTLDALEKQFRKNV